MTVTVILPTYNEAENLPGMVAELLAQDVNELRILVVDDNSPDGTGQVAEDLKGRHPDRVEVLHRSGKQGLGSAYRAGFEKALAGGAEAVVEMDADFSHSPSLLPEMVALLQEYDVVVGSRYVPGGGVDERWGLWRRGLSWWGNTYARLVTGLGVHDVTAGFKVFRASALRALPLERVRSDGYSFQIEMAYACQRAGLRVAEVPIYFEDRVIGSSKMSLPIVAEAIWRVWEIRFRY